MCCAFVSVARSAEVVGLTADNRLNRWFLGEVAHSHFMPLRDQKATMVVDIAHATIGTMRSGSLAGGRAAGYRAAHGAA